MPPHSITNSAKILLPPPYYPHNSIFQFQPHRLFNAQLVFDTLRVVCRYRKLDYSTKLRNSYPAGVFCTKEKSVTNEMSSKEMSEGKVIPNCLCSPLKMQSSECEDDDDDDGSSKENPSGSQAYSCRACHRVFGTFYKRNTHYIDTHCLDRPYACSICNKTFKSKYRLNGHKKDCQVSDG